MKIKYTTAVIIILLITGIFIEIDNTYNLTSGMKSVRVEQVEQVDSPKKFISDYIDNLPDSSLKSNLSAVLGAEYAESSDELNEILQAYAVMKIEELKKQKENYGKPTTDL